jgi:hypothetical protein
MRLQRYLTEGISDIVYHSTSIFKLNQILKTNKFNLSTDLGTGADADLDKNRNKFFYFSTTRHKLGGFSLDPNDGSVMLVLDGRALGNNLSGKPVDYWGPEFRKIDPRKAEAEDRIFHTKPQIDNARKYIKEIHILVPEGFSWNWQDDARNREIRNIWKQALQQKIQIFFYDDKKSYVVQNKKRAIKVDPLQLKATEKQDFGKTFAHSNYFKHWEEMFYIDKYDKLSKRAKDIVWRIAGNKYGDFSFNDYLRSIEADIHNQKSDPKFNTMLSKMFRKAKVTSAKGFLQYLADKWGEILKDR